LRLVYALVRNLLDAGARTAPAFGAALALLSLALFSRGGDGEAAYLILPVLGVLAAAGWLAPEPAREVSAGAVVVVLTTWVLPPGPDRGAAVFLLLAATLALAGGRRLYPLLRPGSAAALPWSVTGPLAVGLQLLLLSGQLVSPVLDAGSLLTFLMLPAVSALSLSVLSACWSAGVAVLAGAVAVLAGSGWSQGSTLILAALAAVSLLRGARARLDRLAPRLERALVVLGGLGAAALFWVSVVAAYPWLRAEPLEVASEAVGWWPVGGAVAAGPAAPLVLDGHERVRWSTEVSPRPVRRLVLDSHLAYAAALPPGTVVATVRLEAEGGRRLEWNLTAGEDTGEWAAGRPDVAARPGFRAPSPWLSWVPPQGAFFARRYRSRFELGEVERPHRLTIERRPDLPPEVQLVLFRAELRP
jgi:hypothetical protein